MAQTALIGFMGAGKTTAARTLGEVAVDVDEMIEARRGRRVQDIFAQGAAGAPNAVSALANALVAKGTTLADAYNAWTAVDLASLYTVPALQGRTPKAEPIG